VTCSIEGNSVEKRPRKRGWVICSGNADCQGAGETPIRITCRNQVRNMTSNHVIAGFNLIGLLISKSDYERAAMYVAKANRIGKKVCWCTGGAVTNHLASFTKRS